MFDNGRYCLLAVTRLRNDINTAITRISEMTLRMK